MLGLVRSVCLLAVLGLVTATAAFGDAGGNGTVTITQHSHDDVLLSDHMTNPCTGAGGILTAVAANDVFHVTFFTNSDEFWVTGTSEGTATFIPDDPGGISYSGHFTAWFGESFNNKNDVQHDTSTFHLTGTDGSRVTAHETSHLSTNANGDVTVDFDKMMLTCS